MKNREHFAKLIADAGVNIGGNQPWDIQIHNPQVFEKIMREPSLGAGESYLDGWWDCQQLDELFFRITRYLEPKNIYKLSTIIWALIKYYLINQQSRLRSVIVAKKHYDLGNDLYQAMLGETMAYTCGYWRDATTLDEAQYAKYDLICKKLELEPGEKILELGCGWGGFAKFAAEKYQVAVTAVNVSVEQMKFAKTNCKDLPVNLHVTDYRNVAVYNPNHIKFDKVVSIGMCEHVGEKNYRHFLKIAHDNLKETGLFLMHTIGKDRTTHFADPWIRKYIFPNGMLPSIKQIAAKMEGLFVLEDLHNFGIDYDKTLMAWFDNFNKHWSELKSQYDERFYRMWKYYLLSCAGGFRSRSMQLWQFVMSPKGKLNGYRSVR
jgi:cyclopropane-fatty-acyl-phospholipid synthase